LARTYFTHNRIVLLIFCHPFCIAIQMSPGGPYLPSFGRCGVSVLLTNTGFNFSYYRRLRNLDNVSFAGDFLHSLAPATLMQTGWQYNTSNQLTSTPSVTYTYDNNGNTLTKVDSGGTTSYAWDIENRLATVTLPGAGGIVSFMYDPFGRRIQKSSAAGTTNYVYDGTNIVAEFDATGTLVARYSQGQGIDQPLAVVRQGTAAYYNADGLGSITSLRDVNGSVVATYGYDAFGNTTAASSINNPFQYTGREWDSETGLYYYRARYYETASGRFVSEDPVGFGGGINVYAYVKNDPVDFIDPTGLECWQSSPWTQIPSMWGPDGPSPYLTITDGVNWVRTGWSYSGLGIDKTHCVCKWVASHTRVRKFYRVTITERAQFTCDCPPSTEYRTRERTKEYEVDGPGIPSWPPQYATTTGTTFQLSDKAGRHPVNKDNVICGCLPPTP
jgi:RHS repeat-associated protein